MTETVRARANTFAWTLIGIGAFLLCAVAIVSLGRGSMANTIDSTTAVIWSNIQETYFEQEGHYGTPEELAELDLIKTYTIEKDKLKIVLNEDASQWESISFEEFNVYQGIEQFCTVTPAPAADELPQIKCDEL